jgi:hypothetical protein
MCAIWDSAFWRLAIWKSTFGCLQSDIWHFDSRQFGSRHLDVCNLTFGLLMVGNLEVDILTVGNLEVGILMCAIWDSAFWRLAIWKLTFWQLAISNSTFWCVQFEIRHFDGRQFGSRRKNAVPLFVRAQDEDEPPSETSTLKNETAEQRKNLEPSCDLGPMLRFLKIFSPKNWRKNWRFWLRLPTAI